MIAMVSSERRPLSELWSFEPPDTAPMQGHCLACGKNVSVCRPRVADISAGYYTIRGECQDCGADVTIVVP